jgi:hypothetical protein
VHLVPDWEAISAIGEAVGALGVILSLIYVGLQVRADARARRAQTLHDQSAAYTKVIESIIQHGDMAEIVIRGSADTSSLNEAEMLRYAMFFGAMFRAVEDAYLQYRRGHLEESVWRGMEGPLDSLGSAGVRAVWSMYKSQGHFSREFVEFVDAKLTTIRERPLAELYLSIATASAADDLPAAAASSSTPAAG